MTRCYFRPPSSTIRLDADKRRSISRAQGMCASVRYGANLVFLLFFSQSLFLCAQIPTNGRVAAWTFSGNANDATGNGHNGTVFGASLIPDRFGTTNSAYYFSGTDHIAVPHHPVLNLESSFTISVWIKFCVRQPRPNDQGGPAIYEKHDPTRPNTAYSMIVYNGEKIWGRVLSDGKWHHLVKMRNAADSTYATYLDAQLISQTREVTWTPPPNTGDLMFGRSRQWRFFGDSGVFFIGAIDDINMYNRALMPGEVVALYRERDWPNSRVRVTASIRAGTVEPAGFCPGDPDPVHLIAEGDFHRVVWSPAAGLNSTSVPNPIAQPAQTTTYTVTAYKYDSSTFCIDTAVAQDTITITLFRPPVIDGGPPFYTCAQETITLGGESAGGTPPYRWEWSPPEGLSDPTAEHPQHVVTQNAQYRVIVEDAKGCRDTALVPISVIPRPLVDLGSDTIYYCIGSAGAEIHAVGSDGNPPYSFTWAAVKGLDRYDTGYVRAKPDAPTRYVVTISDRAGLCTGYDTVIVVPVDPPDADAGRDHVMCAGDSVVLAGKGAGAEGRLVYSWTPATGLDDPTLASPHASPDTTTVYRLRVTDTLTGCFDEDEVRVAVRDVRVHASTDRIDFGMLDGCRIDSTITVRLFNDGPTDGIVESLWSDVPGLSITNGGALLPAGGSVDVRIRFAPSSADSFDGRVYVRVGPCGDSLEFAVTGEKERSTVEVAPADIAFASMLMCELKEESSTIVIVNNGTVDAMFGMPVVGAPYSVGASALPATLKPGERLEIELRFAPTGPGNFADELRIPFSSGSCADSLRLSLRGAVIDLTPTTSFTKIDFGLLDGCVESRDTAVRVDNATSLDVTFIDALLPPDFILLESLPFTVPANGGIDLRIRYAPQGPGNSGGEMALHYEACTADWTFELLGEKHGVSFSIPDTIDFGELAGCEGTTRRLPLPIRFNSDRTGDGVVAGASITGPFTTGVTPGSPLPDGVEQLYDMTFTPPGVGTFTGELILELEPCGSHRRVVLIGRATRAELSVGGAGYDFGTVTVGLKANGTLAFHNGGSATLRVERIDGIAPPFSLISTVPDLPADIAPGEELVVEIEYIPVGGRVVAPIRAVISGPCDLTFEAELRGEGTASAFSTIALPVLSAAPGEPVRMELRIQDSHDLDPLNARRYRAEVAFESSLLAVSDGTPWHIDRGERVVEMEGERLPGNPVLAAVDLTATLGRTERTSLRLVSFEWLDAAAAVRIDTVHGEFALEGLCRDGGTRLYDPNGEIAIKSIKPNPVRSGARVLYSLLESGPHRLRMIDLSGQEVREVFSGPMVPGSYELDLPLDNVSSGLYYLVLETPSVIVTERMEVVR